LLTINGIMQNSNHPAKVSATPQVDKGNPDFKSDDSSNRVSSSTNTYEQKDSLSVFTESVVDKHDEDSVNKISCSENLIYKNDLMGSLTEEKDKDNTCIVVETDNSCDVDNLLIDNDSNRVVQKDDFFIIDNSDVKDDVVDESKIDVADSNVIEDISRNVEGDQFLINDIVQESHPSLVDNGDVKDDVVDESKIDVEDSNVIEDISRNVEGDQFLVNDIVQESHPSLVDNSDVKDDVVDESKIDVADSNVVENISSNLEDGQFLINEKECIPDTLVEKINLDVADSNLIEDASRNVEDDKFLVKSKNEVSSHVTNSVVQEVVSSKSDMESKIGSVSNKNKLRESSKPDKNKSFLDNLAEYATLVPFIVPIAFVVGNTIKENRENNVKFREVTVSGKKIKDEYCNYLKNIRHVKDLLPSIRHVYNNNLWKLDNLNRNFRVFGKLKSINDFLKCFNRTDFSVMGNPKDPKDPNDPRRAEQLKNLAGAFTGLFATINFPDGQLGVFGICKNQDDFESPFKILPFVLDLRRSKVVDCLFDAERSGLSDYDYYVYWQSSEN